MMVGPDYRPLTDDESAEQMHRNIYEYLDEMYETLIADKPRDATITVAELDDWWHYVTCATSPRPVAETPPQDTHEHDRSEIYALCPPLAEWPDEAQWWAMDESGDTYWYRVQPKINASVWSVYGPFTRGRTLITLPAHIDWRDTLVSRAELDEWERTRGGTYDYPEPGWTPPQDTEHWRDDVPVWRNESIQEYLREITHSDGQWLDGKIRHVVVEALAQRVRNDVAAHYEARIAELDAHEERLLSKWGEAQAQHILRADTIVELQARIAELEHERERWGRGYWDAVNTFGGVDDMRQAAKLWRLATLVDATRGVSGYRHWPGDKRIQLLGTNARDMIAMSVSDAIAWLEAQLAD